MIDKICVGRVVNTFGLCGELKVLPKDRDFSLLSKLDEFYLQGFDTPFKCQKITYNGKFAKLKIFGYDDINMVLQFVNCNVLIKSENQPALEPNQFFTADLIGSKIYDNQTQIATILDVENYGASDVLVIQMQNKNCRVPFVDNFFSSINPQQKMLVVTEKFYEGIVCE